jgi:hypothetical protein
MVDTCGPYAFTPWGGGERVRFGIYAGPINRARIALGRSSIDDAGRIQSIWFSGGPCSATEVWTKFDRIERNLLTHNTLQAILPTLFGYVKIACNAFCIKILHSLQSNLAQTPVTLDFGHLRETNFARYWSRFVCKL